MLESLFGRKALDSPEAMAQLNELQTDTLRLFLVMTAVGYFVWHYGTTMLRPTLQGTNQVYTIMPFAVLTLVATYILLPRSSGAAKVAFVGGTLLTITWAIYVLGNPRVALLYVMAALVATFVINPLGGFMVVGATVGLLMMLGSARPDLAEQADVGQIVIFGSLTVVGTWAVMYHLFLALNWFARSYAEAERQTREAEEHRAQLVQAWKQLDTAYYRLERANAALQLAWKAADEAERSKIELTTNISHELRTPLNLVVGYSEMMMTAPGSYGGVSLPPPYRGDLYAIYSSAQHLLELTDDILDMARMDVGQLGFVREPVDLTRVVEDAAALVKDHVEGKGTVLRLSLAPDLPKLSLDRLRIRQVLLNLLTNAARFTEGGRIEIRACREEHGVRVAVSDTGPGITPADLPLVFQRFVSRDRQRADWHSGTGLGLAISQQFIELHGGEMGVESVLGSGTTFWFTLPLNPEAPTEPGTTSSWLAAGYLGQHQQVVILARQDPGLARLFQRHLDGYRVEIADGLMNAEILALESRAAAIIADVDAPGHIPTGPTPVIRCPLPRLEHLAGAFGVDGYLTKPISRDSLMTAIQQLNGSIKRVLIVDDDRGFVRLVSRILGSGEQNYVISVAYNGEEALGKMLADPPELLILDLTMPVLNGLGLLNQMAGQPALKSVKSIVISAHDEGEGAIPIGSDVRIYKPEGLQLAELIQVIGAVVKQMTPVRSYLREMEPMPREGQPG